jgi:hypothetical protein
MASGCHGTARERSSFGHIDEWVGVDAFVIHGGTGASLTTT